MNRVASAMILVTKVPLALISLAPPQHLRHYLMWTGDRPSPMVANRRFLLVLANLAVLLGICTVAAGQGKDATVVAPKLEPAWSKSYPNLYPPPPQLRPVSLAISESARCAAIAGDGEVEVLDAAGQSLWKWNYRTLNRFIVAGPLAVSPNCDAIALAGDSGYKQVWLARQHGSAISLSMSSTPLGVAFDRHGELLAVGTGGNSILLFAKTGKQLWKKTLPGLCLPYEMSFSADNHYILIRDGCSGLLRMDGSVVWTGHSFGMNASADLRTFVTWAEPPHGPGPGSVSRLDDSGKQVWFKFSQDPGAVITPAGDKILARAAVNQNPTEQEMEEPLETNLQVLSRDGTVLKDLSDVDGKPLAISPEGDRALIRTSGGVEGIDMNGTRLFSIALNPMVYTTVLVTADFSGMLVFSRDSDPKLRWYTPK